MINHVQNKSFCLHNKYTPYIHIYYVYMYKNTYTTYILKIFTYVCMCVYIYIILFCMRLII